MKKGDKTVFFGPFVGEFGWEIISWQGWVKRLCRTRYAGYYKIACSFPGRYPFYPEVDEFWPLPPTFTKNPISSRGYITDNWIKGFPKPSKNASELPEVMPLINEVIENFKKKLPKNTEFIVPWELRYDEEDQRYYGVYIPENPTSNDEFRTYAIPLSNQILEELNPTPDGMRLLNRMVEKEKKLISIFPRHRAFRRPDKTWGKMKYEILIGRLMREFPDLQLAILGEPGGAFFADEGVPEKCIDLINIDPKLRLDTQLAALKRSVLAIGGLSGAILLALSARCPALTWGIASDWPGFKRGNYMKTGIIYYPSQNPSVEVILKYVKWILRSGKMPVKEEFRRILITSFYEHLPHFMEKSKTLSSLKKAAGLNF